MSFQRRNVFFEAPPMKLVDNDETAFQSKLIAFGEILHSKGNRDFITVKISLSLHDKNKGIR